MAYDLIVIGGGPAGYVGAIKAAQLGKKVACVEMDKPGGTCLNWGCIPTKSLLRNAEIFNLMKNEADEFGISFDNLSYDWGKIIGRSREVSGKLAGGIEFLLKKNGADYIPGRASVPEAGKVVVEKADGSTEELETEDILIATGVVTREFPDFPINGSSVVGSKQALVMEKQPKDIIIIGAGAIGMEFAYFFNAFGTNVTVVEMMDHLLPVEDEEVSKTVKKSFEKSGVRCLTSTKVVGTNDLGSSVEITVEPAAGGEQETLSAEVCLVAIGVSPLLPEGLELKQDRGYLVTDERYQTSTRGVYAVGDIIGPPWLAHVASYEAIQCMEGLYGGHKPKKVETFPGCTYCQPQVASVGLTEKAAKEKGIAHKIGKFPFQASGKALASGHAEGFVKLLFGEEHGEIIGAHIVGSEATEMIAELGLAINMEATWEDIEATIHAHPTMAEAVHEATGAAYGQAIHIANK